MNIVQMRDKINEHLDHVQSPRFAYTTYTSRLNTAIDKFIEDRYDNIKKRTNYTFQAEQKVRDELYTIIKDSVWTTVGLTNILLYTDTIFTTYRHSLRYTVRCDGGTKEYVAKPMSYLKYGEEIKNDPYSMPSLTTGLDEIYWMETETGIQFFTPSGSYVSQVQLSYLRNPATVSFGTMLTGTALVPGAITPAVNTTILIYDDQTTLTGVPLAGTYESGTLLTMVGGTAYTVVGTICYGYTNCDLPTNTHEELCQMVARMLSGTTEDQLKYQVMDAEVNKS